MGIKYEDMTMANERTNTTGDELLMDVRVAEASALYKFYLNQERKLLGTISVLFSLRCGS